MGIHYGLILLSLLYFSNFILWKRSPQAHGDHAWGGVKPMQIFPFSSCALVAKQQHFNCDWYKQLGFNGNLSCRFKPSFYWCNLLGGCWLCYLLRERERKQNRSVDLFSCPVCRSRTLSGVCFSICFSYREINKLGIKMKSSRSKSIHSTYISTYHFLKK